MLVELLFLMLWFVISAVSIVILVQKVLRSDRHRVFILVFLLLGFYDAFGVIRGAEHGKILGGTLWLCAMVTGVLCIWNLVALQRPVWISLPRFFSIPLGWKVPFSWRIFAQPGNTCKLNVVMWLVFFPLLASATVFLVYLAVRAGIF